MYYKNINKIKFIINLEDDDERSNMAKLSFINGT